MKQASLTKIVTAAPMQGVAAAQRVLPKTVPGPKRRARKRHPEMREIMPGGSNE